MVRRRIEAIAGDHNTSHLQLIGDCVSWMRALPEASVDVVFADPPYLLKNARQRLHGGKLVRDEGMSWDKIDHATWIPEVVRVLRPGGTFFCCCTYHSLFKIGGLAEAGGLRVLNQFTLEKQPAPPCLTARMARQDTENLLWFAKGRNWTFNKEVLREENLKSVWPYPVAEVRGLPHETPKPLSTIRRALRISTQPGYRVLDPFSGINTVAIAGWAQHLHVMSIELHARYARLGAIRMRRYGIPVGGRVVRKVMNGTQA